MWKSRQGRTSEMGWGLWDVLFFSLVSFALAVMSDQCMHMIANHLCIVSRCACLKNHT